MISHIFAVDVRITANESTQIHTWHRLHTPAKGARVTIDLGFYRKPLCVTCKRFYNLLIVFNIPSERYILTAAYCSTRSALYSVYSMYSRMHSAFPTIL